ncbi:MAG: peptidoglycan-associated lipoprotein Pal [Mariprofundus sp.]|nr:peptidoglycan-associated lipoprotein Pal [Mariprofundus sp.]
METTRTTKQVLLIAMVSAAMLFAGCSKKVEVTDTSSKPAQTVSPVESASAQKPSSNSVYFAFDSSDLDAAARATLDGYAEWLNANASTSITIEGNCDERGSREYNLALGQRRADSVRDYLSSRSVNSSRVDTVSFGEERPACQGSGESCWAQNRRGDIVTR